MRYDHFFTSVNDLINVDSMFRVTILNTEALIQAQYHRFLEASHYLLSMVCPKRSPGSSREPVDVTDQGILSHLWHNSGQSYMQPLRKLSVDSLDSFGRLDSSPHTISSSGKASD